MEDEIRKKARQGQRETLKELEQADRGKKRGGFRHLKSVDPVLFNEGAEEEFIRIVRELLGEQAHGKVKRAAVLQECAYELKVSTETVKRYLFKHTARKAEFREFDGWVFLNPKYVAMSEEDEE